MYEYKARCLKVVDGDTLDLEIDLGFRIKSYQRVRLARVNAPEVRGAERPEGLKAEHFVTEKLVDQYGPKELYISTEKTGKYGRWIAEIQYPSEDGLVNLSDEMVKQDHAKYVEY